MECCYGIVDERAVSTKRVLNPWKRNENHTLCLNSAKAIGCTVVNIGTQHLAEGRIIAHTKENVVKKQGLTCDEMEAEREELAFKSSQVASVLETSSWTAGNKDIQG
ncbi:hypothetical protein OIU84_015418 [Salix udensis]|uniref:Uncharacterized protein n=1 Tax=Salix udensis TaxID=889485 RepID=A0AAD6JEN9_9ROSI|nr:hypothetical protein OIU84_015418 [Salix udensis]